MELAKTQNNQLAQKSTLPELSQRLISSLLMIEAGEKTEGKMQLTTVVSDLMPQGNPDLLGVIKFPMIGQMVKSEGKSKMMKLIFVLVKDFCASINVVRNMNEDQMIEAAAMLLDECGNFRLEDYTMMFNMAKRGQLVKIMDRIDISIITQMLDAYWDKRHYAGKQQQMLEDAHYNSLGDTVRDAEGRHVLDEKINRGMDNLSGAIGSLKNQFQEWKEDNKLRDELKSKTSD